MIVHNQAPLAHPTEIFVDGEWARPSTDALIEVIAPATEEVYLRVANAQVADVDLAVAAARIAFDAGPWPRMSPAERAGYLNAIAAELSARAGDIAAIWPNEMGITYSMASAYAGGAGPFFQFYAGLAESFPFEEEHATVSGAKLGLLVREPVGVVGAIIPWNGPIMLLAFKVAPALLAGCTVVIKGSPEAPGHALLFAEVCEKVGLPRGVVNVVIADREASEALVRNPGIDKIGFTGSSATGRRIASILGDRMARYTLELGGKSAAIILDDYDIETAAKELATRECDMSGQVCASLTRVIVPRRRADQVADALGAVFRDIVVGDPFDPAVQMGPVATRVQRDKIIGHLDRAKADGFRLVAGGGKPAHLDRGWFIEPTVFAGVDNRAAIAQEEIFGPVLSVIPADDEDHAVRLANDSPYGLNAAVFTHDADRAYAVARQIRSGTVGHNGHLVDFTIAFGGFKQSGVGREGGVEGLLPYLETKTVLLNGRPSHLG
ncbi:MULTISPECIES: aldehyde dehydrogenase [unclassified Novosphingobium]|uniref:aldehyde dehydrogenase n=1 Tax=unclassified Novosphingobium TaxID=2644732 RepID=UPI000D2FC1AD|nr:MULTISPECIES: aldehyde dehydrogenase [unclassified Novosphingobium]PTR05800.1 betaine-aldehyde dehydrogenase [Novosphingobium sp. GV055]PUA94358.1 betaine-aldehyde dehydrogenase [Novosphingobium sp. GV061]PUB12664.1 betaine-aldehyde dehydrogenase [Novosphingobium sp. GV079]PUB38029.1 betaine-aldehyde dehydrogenase [Novosphingobium sp. GV027]